MSDAHEEEQNTGIGRMDGGREGARPEEEEDEEDEDDDC